MSDYLDFMRNLSNQVDEEQLAAGWERASRQLFHIYSYFRKAGFNEDQALKLVTVIIIQGMQDRE